MSLQRKHFLLSYLKTLSVGPAGVWTHDLPHGSLVLNQLSQPVGKTVKQQSTGQQLSFEWKHFMVSSKYWLGVWYSSISFPWMVKLSHIRSIVRACVPAWMRAFIGEGVRVCVRECVGAFAFVRSQMLEPHCTGSSLTPFCERDNTHFFQCTFSTQLVLVLWRCSRVCLRRRTLCVQLLILQAWCAVELKMKRLQCPNFTF